MKIQTRFLVVLAILLIGFSLSACQGIGVTPVPLETISQPTQTGDVLEIDITPTAYLRIVNQNPFDGERLGLSQPIEIAFDRPVQPESVESAWQFVDVDGKPVTGQISWANPQTFQFHPARNLKAGQIYTGFLSQKVVATDGAQFAQDVRFEFRTTDELVVGQVFPADKTEDVDNRSSITVIFNKPVIPLMTMEDQARLPSPIVVQPAIKGTGNWVNSSVFVFQPEEGMKSGTHYQVSVRGDIEDVTGTRLASEYSWEFTTRVPYVTDFALKDFGQGFIGEVQNVLLDQAFIVTFSQTMDPDSFATALSLRNFETGQDAPVKLSWDTTFTVLTITPARRLTVDSFYTLEIGQSAMAKDGGVFSSPYQIKLSTVPLPAVMSVDPSEGKQKTFSSVASVYFNTQMKADTLKTRVKISPEPRAAVKIFYHEDMNRLDILGLEPSQKYVVRLLPGMTDIYGNSINSQFSFSFETAGLSSYARLVAPNYPLIYRQLSEQSIFFEYTNLDSAKISLFKVSFDEFSGLTGGTTEMDNLAEGKGKLVREWSPELKAGKDRPARILLQIAEGKPLSSGYYYLGLDAMPLEKQRRFNQGVIFVVSNDTLALKATQSEAMAWLVGSESGQPVAGSPVVFYNDKFEIVGKAATDSNGLAHLPDAVNAQYVQSVDENHLALAALSWGAGVNEGQFGIWTEYWSPVKGIFAHTYTERPLYRPNQPVFIKGIVRDNDDLHYSLPALDKVYLTIENEQGKVFGEDVALSKNGTFASEYLLGPDAPVGNYSITVRGTSASDTILSWTDFRVAEYVKPEFQVSASASPVIALNGDEVTFNLDAVYYSGGGLADANVSWFMEMQPYLYSAPELFNGYSFNDFDYYDYYYYGGQGTNGPPVFKDGQGQTDEKGHFELKEILELSEDSSSRQVSFSANVTDVGGNLVGSSTSVTLLGSALHAGIRPENYVGMAGEAQKFNLVVLDIDGKPVAKQAVNVSFAEQQWFSVVRKDENGVSRWETSVKTIPAGSVSAVTDENGLANVEFIPMTGGEYKATITALDEKGRLSKAASYLWVSSRDYVSWRQTNDRSFQLIADKDSYNPGDTARILIAQPFEGENYALITNERGHIYEKKVVKLQNNSTLYELPITSDMAPVMYVSVMVVKGADGKTPPDFKTGLLRININPSRQNIFVSVESDRTTAQPGETVTYTVKTSDLDGKPVQADLSLALVDKAVLALAPDNNLSLLDAFYPLRGLSVISASSIVLNAEDFNANYQATDPSGERGGGGGKGEGDTGVVTVRGNFKDTAFWQAQVLTDENGMAQVQVTLPDNLTTWQMKARAVTDDTRVGEAQSELLSTRPLQIQLQTPRFFVVDDKVTLGAVVHNNTGQELDVEVSLQAEGLVINSQADQNITVKPNQQAYVTWDVAVGRQSQRVDLVASVKSGVFADSTRPTLGTLPGQGLPVYAYHVTETVGSAGFLREAGSVSEAISLPQSLDFYSAALDLKVSPSLASSMIDGLSYLNDYPYLCMEQTVSRFLPNLISLEAIRLAGRPSEILQKSLDEQVQPALQRIIGNQNSDGGWGLWPGADSQPTTTAYVLLGLVEARKAGYTFPESVEEYGLTYLEEHLPYSFADSATWQNNQAAFMMYAMSEGNRPNRGRSSSLYAARENLDIYGKALLMQALYAADPKDERIQVLLSEINSSAVKSATGTWWNEKEVDYWNWNTDVRTTAIVLNALIHVDPQSALLPDGIRWLMLHRDGSHWYSTQETAWSLMALTNWLSLSDEFNTNYSYAIGLNGNLLETRQADSVHLDETASLRLDVEKLLTDQTNYLVLTRGDGPGVLYYTAYMDYSLPVKDVSALDQGILVTQQYFHEDDLKTPITEIKRGELVQVRLTLVVPESLHYVVIDNPLPAGLEAVDSSLQTSQQIPMQYQAQDYDRYGWGWWYFYYKQIYDEKVVMSADFLPAGTYTITYFARASTAGQFHVLPATAKEFYFPEVAGRSAGADFVVKP